MRWIKRITIGLILMLVAAVALLWTPDTDPAEMRARYGGPPSQFVRLADGLTVHLRDERPRDAPVIMLLHGSNDSLHTWDRWVATLKNRYRIVRFDQIGHGLTGPDPSRDYSPGAFVATVEQVRERLGIERMTVGGNSMGGGVAWRYAAAHSDRVAALVLVDASGAPREPGRAPPLTFRLASNPLLRPILLHLTPRRLVAAGARDAVSVLESLSETDIDRYWLLLRYPGNRQATIDRQTQMRPADEDRAVRRISAPTLILWGRDDRVLPVAGARWFAARIGGARTIVYPRVGHLPMVEVPGQSAADVARFLTSLGAPVSPRQRRRVARGAALRPARQYGFPTPARSCLNVETVYSVRSLTSLVTPLTAARKLSGVGAPLPVLATA